jgi:Cu/Ag efflux protein CusF
MRTKTILSIVGTAAALGTGAVAATGAVAQSSSTAASASASASAQASRFVRHIEGPVVAIDRAARTFTVRDREHRNALSTIHLTPSTRFDGVAGLGGLHNGQRVEVKAVRVNGALSATKVERGAREAEAGDDRGARGAEAGDDRGARGAEAGDDRGARGAEAGDDRGARGAEAGEDRGHDGPGHDAGDDRGHGGHDG